MICHSLLARRTLLAVFRVASSSTSRAVASAVRSTSTGTSQIPPSPPSEQHAHASLNTHCDVVVEKEKVEDEVKVFFDGLHVSSSVEEDQQQEHQRQQDGQDEGTTTKSKKTKKVKRKSAKKTRTISNTNKVSKFVYGFGINDASYTLTKREPVIGSFRKNEVWRCPYYMTWTRMLKMCYSQVYLETHPTYVGCSVSEEWRSFMCFKRWMEEQVEMIGWDSFVAEERQLSRIFLVRGCKVFSPETCLFVPQAINKLLNDRRAARGIFPQGVYFNGIDAFVAMLSRKFKKIVPSTTTATTTTTAAATTTATTTTSAAAAAEEEEEEEEEKKTTTPLSSLSSSSPVSTSSSASSSSSPSSASLPSSITTDTISLLFPSSNNTNTNTNTNTNANANTHTNTNTNTNTSTSTYSYSIAGKSGKHRLGVYNTPETAHKAYMIEKGFYLLQVADSLSHPYDERLANCLANIAWTEFLSPHADFSTLPAVPPRRNAMVRERGQSKEDGKRVSSYEKRFFDLILPSFQRFRHLHGHTVVRQSFVVPFDKRDEWPDERLWGLKLGRCLDSIRHKGTYKQFRAELLAVGVDFGVWRQRR